MSDRPVGFYFYYRHLFGVKANFREELLYLRLMVSMSVLIRMDLYLKSDFKTTFNRLGKTGGLVGVSNLKNGRHFIRQVAGR